MPLSLNSSRVSCARVVFAALCAASASLPTVGLGQTGKLKQPEQVAISKEVAVVKSTFEREIQEAAKDEAAATKLVDELLSKVPATPDPEGKWALMQVAQEIAVEGSVDIEAAMKCVTVRARVFDVDVVKERLDVLKEFSKPKHPANATLYGKAVQAARDALRLEKYSEAREAAGIASDVAKALLKDEKEEARRILKQNKGKVKPPAPVAEATYVLPAAQLGKRIVEAESLSNANAAALPVWVASPNDKAAQGSIGEYKCYLKSAWAEGLSLIANSRNPKVAEIASTELRARDPLDTAKLLEVADQWWELARNELKESEVKREAIQRHAVDIYALVSPNLKKPLDQKRAKDRIAELGQQPPVDHDFAPNREAAEWVLRLGGSVTIEDLKKVRHDIDQIAKLPRDPFYVVSINLTSKQGVNDQELARLEGLTRLEAVGVGGTPVTDALFDHLRRLPNLRYVGVNWTGVTGKGLATLIDSKLTGLEISGMKDPEAAIVYLHKKGVAEWINFDGMKMTPECVRLLGEMKTLKKLHFREGLVTPEQVEELKKKIPSCEIHIWK